jgi:hypothetical protein
MTPGNPLRQTEANGGEIRALFQIQGIGKGVTVEA